MDIPLSKFSRFDLHNIIIGEVIRNVNLYKKLMNDFSEKINNLIQSGKESDVQLKNRHYQMQKDLTLWKKKVSNGFKEKVLQWKKNIGEKMNSFFQ